MANNKKFEINLTPHNEEWIKLIPNPSQNMDNIFNKLVDITKDDGLLLEIITQCLTVADLSKFKTAYSKMNAKRAEHVADLDINVVQVERKKPIQTQIVEQEEIHQEPIKSNSKKEKKMTHGFDESTF